MKIDKLHLRNYGQFEDREFTLSPGINVFYGANEAGKSTTKDFIVDMLYGIDATAASGVKFDHYEKRRPIYQSGYAGAMEVTTDAGQYLIERNFDRQEQSVSVRDLNTGQQVPLGEGGDLVGTVFHTDKSTYMNTLCIGHMGAATDHEITERLGSYIVNMASSKAGEIDAVSAIMALKNKKKEFSIEKLAAKEKEITGKLQLDRDFDAEIAAVKEEIARVEAEKAALPQEQIQFTPIHKKQEEAEAPEQEGQEPEEAEEEAASKHDQELNMLRNMGRKSILDNVMVIFLAGLLVVALFIGIAYAVPVNVPEVKIGIIAAGVVYGASVVYFVLRKRAKLYRMLEELEIEQNFEEAKEENDDLNRQREIQNRLGELGLKERRILEDRREQEKLLEELNEIRRKQESCNVELAALDLAINTIEDLSEEIYESFGEVLNTKVSEIIARITGNRYCEVKIDDQLRVMVRNGNSFIRMEYLSTGTMEQIYLALRLSIAGVLLDETLPLIMDDIFVTYDDQRIYDTLSCLGDYTDRQVILFTTNRRIMDMFNHLGMECNYIVI